MQNMAHIDHLSLNDFADFLEAQADTLRHQAIANADRPEEAQAGAIDYLLRTPRIVMRHLRQGCALDEALEKAAQDTGAPLGSIRRAWKRFVYDKSAYEVRRRNVLILELAAMGFKNADIGRKVNLHPNTVSRIIAQARRTYHAARQADNRIGMQILLSGGQYG